MSAGGPRRPVSGARASATAVAIPPSDTIHASASSLRRAATASAAAVSTARSAAGAPRARGARTGRRPRRASGNPISTAAAPWNPALRSRRRARRRPRGRSRRPRRRGRARRRAAPASVPASVSARSTNPPARTSSVRPTKRTAVAGDARRSERAARGGRGAARGRGRAARGAAGRARSGGDPPLEPRSRSSTSAYLASSSVNLRLAASGRRWIGHGAPRARRRLGRRAPAPPRAPPAERRGGAAAGSMESTRSNT